MADVENDDREWTAADARARKSPGIRINGVELNSDTRHEELVRSVEMISDLEIRIQKLTTENRELTDRCSRLARELQSLRSGVGAPTGDSEELREENRRLRENNARLERVVAELNRERGELLQSLPSGANALSVDRSELWKNQRVVVLVDVQNMYYSAKKIYNSKVSFHKLLPTLVRNRQLVRAIAYTVEKEGTDQEKFYDVLRHSGFEIKSRQLIVRSDGSRKGDWDMGIAIDAISMIDKVDVVILVTGDGDFVALVNMLKGRGVRVEVASFQESTADNLLLVADEHRVIDERLLID